MLHRADPLASRQASARGARAASWYPMRPLRAPRHSGPAGEPQPEPRLVSNVQPEVPTPCPPPARRWPPSTARSPARLVHRLRKAGRLPAVVYGHGEALDQRDGRRPRVRAAAQAHRPERPGRPVDRRQEGRSRSSSTSVQVHPVNRRPLHADLFLVKMTEELTVDVPLVATGESLAVSQLGGTLLHPTETVKVKGAARSPAPVHRVLHRVARRLRRHAPRPRPGRSPSDVTLLTDGDEIIAKVQPPRVEVEEAPVVAEGEAEEGAEGEAAEGAAPRVGDGDAARAARPRPTRPPGAGPPARRAAARRRPTGSPGTPRPARPSAPRSRRRMATIRRRIGRGPDRARSATSRPSRSSAATAVEGSRAMPRPWPTICLAASMLSSSMTPSGVTPAERKSALVRS